MGSWIERNGRTAALVAFGLGAVAFVSSRYAAVADYDRQMAGRPGASQAQAALPLLLPGPGCGVSGDIEVCATSVASHEELEQRGGPDLVAADDGSAQFVLAKLRLTNRGPRVAVLMLPAIELRDSGGRTYPLDLVAQANLPLTGRRGFDAGAGDLGLGLRIPAAGSVEGWTLFVVPKTARGLQLAVVRHHGNKGAADVPAVFGFKQ